MVWGPEMQTLIEKESKPYLCGLYDLFSMHLKEYHFGLGKERRLPGDRNI